MFASPRHPLLEQAIHNLITFDHSWFLNYPTVMFSTGPMFLSIQYGLYTSHPGSNVRILPKSLYGKNALPEDVPNSFFAHYYGSSWHSDDAAFVWFLGTWGKGLMWVGLAILIFSFFKMSGRPRRSPFRRIGSYDVLLPRWSQRSGRWHLHLGWSSSAPASGSSTSASSPIAGTEPSSPENEMPVIHLPFDVRTSSSSSSPYYEATEEQVMNRATSVVTPLANTFRRIRAAITGHSGYDRLSGRQHSRPSRGVLFFLPAIFAQPTHDVELEHTSRGSRSPPLLSTPRPRSPRRSSEKQLPMYQQDGNIGPSTPTSAIHLNFGDAHHAPTRANQPP